MEEESEIKKVDEAVSEESESETETGGPEEAEEEAEAPVETAENRCPLGYKAHCDKIDECRKSDKLRFMCINMHKPKFKDDEWH